MSVAPYFHYSQYNSIRFAQVVEWDAYDKPKTVPNTLSYQEDGINAKSFCQLYQLEDAVRLQFKSSYPTNVVTVRGCDGSETNISPAKRTNNLDLTDVRTGNISNLDGYKLVVYFSGPLPDWMVVGLPMVVTWPPPADQEETGTIEKIVWLEDQQVYGVQISQFYYDGNVSNVSVSTTYNAFEYNIYEFDVDFSQFSAGKYQIEINASGLDGEEDVCYLSERIFLQEEHENTYQFIAEHNENTQINYTWGIQHMMRLEYESPLKYSPDGDQKIHKFDSNTILLDSSNYETYEIELSPLPTGMAIKVSLFVSLSKLFIASRSYVASTVPTTERLGSSNLYDCKVILILSNEEYDNKMEDYKNGSVTPGDFNNDFNNDFL